MAKQRVSGNFSRKEKCDYYAQRVNNSRLTKNQRKYALRRLNALCGDNKSGSRRSRGRC